MSGDRLPAPIREVLDVEPEETDVPRLWRGVEERRARRRARHRGAAPFLAAAAVLLLVGTWVVASQRSDPSAAPDRLVRVDGAPFAGDLAPAQRVALSDGSWIETGSDTRLSVLHNDGRDVVLHLREGDVDVEVHPGGPRRWVIEAGEAVVEVVGTHFTVSRQGHAIRVSVSRGQVIVRHPDLDDGLQRLGAGRSVEVGESAPPDPPTSSRPTPTLVEPTGTTGSDAVPEPSSEEEEPSPARPTSPPAPVPSADSESEPRARRVVTGESTASPDELLSLADVARDSGHPELAVSPLEQLLRDHPRHRNAPIAAFTLAQIELDRLGRPRAAARHLEQALALGLGPLEADARARLAIARGRTGDASGARSAACDYLEAQPNGAHAAAMRELCSSP